jgi:thiamine biosynthesis lipoprotein
MKCTELIMGMPITVEVIDYDSAGEIEQVFDYFRAVDERYSTYKATSEIALINRGLPKSEWSDEIADVLRLCEQTKKETNGYFDIRRSDGLIDPSGLVKGWAIDRAANLLRMAGKQQFYIEAGGDIQTQGVRADGRAWHVGVRSPFNHTEIVKVLHVAGQAVATSGTYIRGEHIYNPNNNYAPANSIASLTVIGWNIYDVDRFATAAFAMGKKGIHFITHQGMEAYMIDIGGTATYTPRFMEYVIDDKSI